MILVYHIKKTHAKENIKVEEPETVQKQYADDIPVPIKVKKSKINRLEEHVDFVCDEFENLHAMAYAHKKTHAEENIKVEEPETVQEQYVDEISVPKKSQKV